MRKTVLLLVLLSGVAFAQVTNPGGGTSSPPDWANISNKPLTFAPTAHTHDYGSLNNIPAAFTPSAHTHVKANISDWPSTFPPSAHRHDATEIDNLPASGSIPAGLITFIDTGACPSGWAEVTGMSGYYILATKTTNSDVGTTGGSSSYTPAGTVTSTFTGNSVTSSAVSAGTPAGTIPAHTGTQKFTVNSSGTIALTGTATNIFTGTAMGTHTHTTTATGNITSPFSGTAATITPPYIKLIPCKKS